MRVDEDPSAGKRDAGTEGPRASDNAGPDRVVRVAEGPAGGRGHPAVHVEDVPRGGRPLRRVGPRQVRRTLHLETQGLPQGP